VYVSAFKLPIGGAAVSQRTVCVAVVILFLSSAAAARQSDAFDICAQNADPTARLACFDREQAARNAADPASAPTAARATPAPAARVTPAPAAQVAPAPAAQVAPAPAVRAAPASAAVSGASSSDRDVGLDALELRRQRAQRGETQPAAPAPIEAMLIKVISRQPLINAFELDNGQIWEQSEAKRIAATPNQKVVITHGVLGAFFLKTADGTVVVRVHRLK
jgi:hypothetical protein